MEETQIEVTNYDKLIFFKAHLPIKIQISTYLFKNLFVFVGYLLQYVGIGGYFIKTQRRGVIAFYPGGHTA